MSNINLNILGKIRTQEMDRATMRFHNKERTVDLQVVMKDIDKNDDDQHESKFFFNFVFSFSLIF